MSEYRVNLDIFAGPLDLLLYLVRKEEVDIYDIPIARITEQYINYVELLKRFDIELAGDFLVMAATLMEIKSIMLLPSAEEDPESDSRENVDPRSELVRQLLEYKKFKDAANLLELSSVERSSRHGRPDTIISSLKPDREPELDMDEVSIWTLLESFDTIMQSLGNYQSYEHIDDDTPIDFYQIEILHRLQTEGPASFQSIFTDRKNKLVMVGMFLAILELCRDQLIAAEQAEQLGDIYLRPLTDEPAEQAVHNIIYANTFMEEQAREARQAENTAGFETGQDPHVVAEAAEPDQQKDIEALPEEAQAKSEQEIRRPSTDAAGIIEQAGTHKPEEAKPGIPIVQLPPEPRRAPVHPETDRLEKI